MVIAGENADHNLPISSLPKSVLQSVYHAATGKTESLSKVLSGNVAIHLADIDRLYEMLVDQLGIHEKIIEPTVTVVVKHAGDRSLTYSSWERFKALRVNDHEVTSEVTLKLEFVIQLPQTPQPQRCIVTVNLDSSLPIIRRKKEQIVQLHEQTFLLLRLLRNWRTVDISIDFVDFLVAKGFSAVVEEWFSTLRKTPVKKFNQILFKHFGVISTSLGQFSRIGMAAYLASYVWFSGGAISSLTEVILAVSFGLLIWSAFFVIQMSVRDLLLKRVTSNIVPSVILLTNGDETAYEEVVNSLYSTTNTVVAFIVTILITILVNVFSSYIYQYLVS